MMNWTKLCFFGFAKDLVLYANMRLTAVRGLRLLLLAGTNFSILVVCYIWQVLILAFFKIITCFSY